MDFDTIIDRRGTFSTKWDRMEALYGVSPQDGLSMWVADMDFQIAPCIQTRLREMVDHAIPGYGCEDAAYREAICWWMSERHGWAIRPDWIFTTTGLVNAVGLCLDTFTQPEDGVVLFTPVYHAFARAIRAAGRQVVECVMPERDGRYELDFEAWDRQMTGSEKMLILCSPHNPGGRVWTTEELRGVAAFAQRHDLLLISDDVHHDLVFEGAKYLPIATAAPEISDRLITLTAPSKTFNLAGLHNGNVIIGDADLRARFAARVAALSLAPNTFGQAATAAAYSPEGANWVDQLLRYIDGNRRLFDAAIEDIPGLRSMRLESTYLAWVDFSGTGMSPKEFIARVEKDAKIAANHGDTFGRGGETFLRFNLGTQRSRVEETCKRLRAAFADLQ